MKCLLRNKESLLGRGVLVPGPGRYRKLFKQSFTAMEGVSPKYDAREVLKDAILDGASADRAVLSNGHFFGSPQGALRRGFLYPKAPERMAYISRLFHSDDLELFLAIRNPATFLPLCFMHSPHETIAEFMGRYDPRVVRWSDSIKQIREAAPRAVITVWCNEDAPILWPQVIREMAGLDHGEEVVGGYDLMSDIMSETGMQRFEAFVKRQKTMTEFQHRHAMAAFLNKYAIDEEIEEEIDLPGWTSDLIEEMTEIYEDDAHDIERIPGVQLLSL